MFQLGGQGPDIGFQLFSSFNDPLIFVGNISWRVVAQHFWQET